jgi:hypothetical protein
LRFIPIYFRIAIFTLVFFSSSFGIIFLRTIFFVTPSSEDNGLGMAYVLFTGPVLMTVLLLLICAYFMYWSKNKNEISPIGFVLTTMLTIPVAIFGFLMLVASLFMLIKLIIHP